MAPPQASNFAAEHDAIFYTLLGLTVFFTAIVSFFVVYFAAKYRKGTKVDRSRPIYEHLYLELTWTILPTIIALIVFYFGTKLFIEMRTPPANATEIFGIGKQWMWHFEHPNGIRENNELHVPVGTPVKITLISQDVLHALYLPAFRQQIHVVPGRYTNLWFTATEAGEYHLLCGMYCGTQHSEMGGKVIAMNPRDFAEWQRNGGVVQPRMTMEQAGAKLFAQLSCNNCHGATDNERAPSLYGIYGKTHTFSNASPATVDREYLRESILRPYNRLSTGYDKTMPAYEGQISEEDLLNLIAYIQVLGSTAAPNATGLTTAAALPTESSNANGQDMLSVNAQRAEKGNLDVTPTNRGANPSVNAIAAENRNR